KGSSLSKPVREFFEPRLGVDLGNVKVHTGSNANTLARSVNARAFTYQNQIVFGKGQYQPGTTEGNKLIGHELVHTVQQGKAIYRKPDLPNLRASDEFYELLQNIEKTTKFPIYSMILNSPTLRPYAVEQAAKADILENTSTHPGTTFKGTVGEAYVLYRLLYAGNEKNAWLTDMFNFAFPQPMTMIEEGINKHLGDYSLESFSELLGLLDGYMPDLLLLRLGGEFEVKTGAVDTRLEVVPTINNAITKDNTRVHQHRLGSETCVCLYEITTSWAINHLIKRAIDVATWANLVSRLKKSIPVYSILAIDRGAYFNLLRNNPDKARELVNTVTSKGGIIQLFSDLSKEAGERSRDIISKIKSLP
ncbi:MAG: DUF4157 domain-containing protein, partial [Spirochaetales bacterium]|nr:DUF4157 domain-containing protein [Spirochaetales bacterium]